MSSMRRLPDGDLEVFHSEWTDGNDGRFQIKTLVTTADRHFDIAKRTVAPEREDILRRNLQASSLISNDGLAHQQGERIIGRIKDPVAQAKAIYDWVVDNTTYDAMRELDPERGSVYAGTLMSALESGGGGGFVARAVPRALALLPHLGFTETVDCYLIDQHGRRAATAGDVARERELRDLVVDELRSVIVARHGQLEISGRPMLCTLLSALIQARGAAVPPDALYRQVWGVVKDYSQDQVGAVSLLARMEVAGLDVGDRWQDVAEHMRGRAGDTVQPFLTLQYLYGLARAE